MDAFHGLYLAGALHGLVLAAALLLMPHPNRRANAVLALLVGLIVLPLWNLYVYGGAWQRWAFPGFLMWGSVLLWGPALHGYVGTLSGQAKFNTTQIAQYGAPAILVAVLVYVLDKQPPLTPETLLAIKLGRLMLFYLLMAIYFIACFRLLTRYSARIKNNYSHIEHLNLSWLSGLVGLFAVAILIDMMLSVPALISGQSSAYLVLYMMLEAIIVFAIGYFAMLRSATVYSQPMQAEPAENATPLEKALADGIAARLSVVMNEKEAFKKNDLRLSELAEMVGVGSEILSKFINENCRKNFYEYVNAYRVKSAALMLSADEQANIEKVAFDAGFNNRVSFHHAFKKLTGKTPSQYRRGERSERCITNDLERQPAGSVQSHDRLIRKSSLD